MIIDLSHLCCSRAYQLGKVRARPNRDRIQVPAPDIARNENQELAEAAEAIANALATLQDHISPPQRHSPTLRRKILELVLKFSGQPLTEAAADRIMRELEIE
jgi:hypothetical protein